MNTARKIEQAYLNDEECLAQGVKLWRIQSAEPPELRDVIWLLIGEAARTMRALPGDGPSSKTGFWPEIVWTSAEIAQAYNEVNTEQREAEKQKRLVERFYEQDKKGETGVSSAALSRFLIVMDWLRYVKCRNQKSLRMQLLIALSAGLSPTAASRADRFASLNFGTRQAVDAFRNRALNNIEAEVRQRAPKFIPGAY